MLGAGIGCVKVGAGLVAAAANFPVWGRAGGLAGEIEEVGAIGDCDELI
jgi:hypothetical protein